jgi:circadian clock protein KaiB
MIYRFRLYVAGDTPRSARALANLSALCRRELGESHKIEVIDVIRRPELAEEASVLATPLVIRVHPLPQRRAVGDFTDLERLAAVIDLPTKLATEDHA